MPSTAVTPLDATNATAARKENAGQRPLPQSAARHATDDEILGLIAEVETGGENAAEDAGADSGKPDENGETEEMRAAFEANPELRQAWDDAKAYRETFATPEEARNATALLADLNRLDALFFSRRPEDHAELARSIASLDAAAFASLAKAIEEQAGRQQGRANSAADGAAAPEKRAVAASPQQERSNVNSAGFSPAQADFFQAANAAAVQGVLDAIETQVERLLPEGASKSARNRVVGEIYRELDANRQLSQQVRDAFRSGALDANHQRAIVSLITGRARQALPGVAKRVMNEWTSTVVAANQDRRARQRAAEGRVDIAGSSGAAGEGRRSMAPRDIDYARMSDGDILNL
jgi:hypothetical protein